MAKTQICIDLIFVFIFSWMRSGCNGLLIFLCLSVVYCLNCFIHNEVVHRETILHNQVLNSPKRKVGNERVTGRKARGLQMEEIGCKLSNIFYPSLKQQEEINYKCQILASLIAQLIKNPPANRETRVQFLGWEDPLEEGIGYPLQLLWPGEFRGL